MMLDVRPLLSSLRAGRRWVVVGVLAGIFAGGLAWYVSGVSYLGVVTMAVNQPRSSPATVSTSSYRALFENYSMAAQAIKNAGLTRRGKAMTPDWFLKYVLSVQERRNTNLLQIQVRLKDPELAAKVANDVSQQAIELGRRLSQEEGTSLRDSLKAQRDEAWKAMQDAADRVLDYKKVNRLEMVRTEVDALIRQRQNLLAVEVELSSEKARVATALAEQNARTPKLTLERRIDQDATVLEAARAQAGAENKSLLGLGLKTEELNPTYLRLDSEVALSRARIAQLERQRQAIFEASEAEQKNGRLSDLYVKELGLARLESDHTLARKVYEDIAMRYEHARADATSASAQLQITDPALPLRTPVSWSIWIWLAMGAVVGALVFPGVVITQAVARGISSVARSAS